MVENTKKILSPKFIKMENDFKLKALGEEEKK